MTWGDKTPKYIKVDERNHVEHRCVAKCRGTSQAIG